MIMDKTVNNNNIANPTIDDLNAEKPAENTDKSTKILRFFSRMNRKATLILWILL